MEFDAQRAVSDLAASVPAWVLPAVVLAVSSFVAWRRMKRTDTPAAR